MRGSAPRLDSRCPYGRRRDHALILSSGPGSPSSIKSALSLGQFLGREPAPAHDLLGPGGIDERKQGLPERQLHLLVLAVAALEPILRKQAGVQNVLEAIAVQLVERHAQDIVIALARGAVRVGVAAERVLLTIAEIRIAGAQDGARIILRHECKISP